MPVLTKINTNVIADNAVTAAKTDQGADSSLSGTISGQRLQLSDEFTLTGDLTVNDDLVLGKVTDDGTGQSLTGSGKTITGTGTLTMGSSVTGRVKEFNQLAGNVTATGGTFSGTVTVPTPTATGHATTKAYVDSAATQATTAAQALGTGDSPTFANMQTIYSGEFSLSSNQTGIGTAKTKIILNQTVFSNSNLSLNSGSIRCAEAGLYMINFRVQVYDNLASGYLIVEINVGGVQKLYNIDNATGSEYSLISGTLTQIMTGTNTDIELFVDSQSDSSYTITSSTELNVTRLAPNV